MNPFSGQKIFQHADRVAEWQTFGDTRPVTVEIDMTNSCTDRCGCCAGGRKMKSAELERSLAISTVKDLAEFGVHGLIFTGGGEPLCNKDTPAIMKIAKTLGMDVGLITNGVLLDADTATSVTETCTWVRVSLDAHNADLYEHTHGTTNFNRVITNIGRLVSARDWHSVTIGVGYLVGADTLHGMPVAAEICRNLGVDYLQFRPFHGALAATGVPQKALYQFRESQKYATDKYAVVWSEAKFRAALEHPEGYVRQYDRCYGHAFATVIAADGTVYLCCHMRGKDKYALGNLHDQTFKQIWYGKRRTEVTQNIDFGDCVSYCRCDPFNVALWQMKHNPPCHVNFL